MKSKIFILVLVNKADRMEILLFGSTGMVGTAVETVCKDRQITCISIPHSDADITNPHDLKNVIE